VTDGYANVNRFIVILADDRNPWTSFQNHLDRGSAGGVDCVAIIGTPIFAPADCYLANTPNNGTGGNTITMSFNDGWRDQMMHLSRMVAGGPKRKGDLVGYSGDSGSPGAPHVHWHRVDPSGKRRNPWDYFTGSQVSAVTVEKIEEEEDMAYLRFITDNPNGAWWVTDGLTRRSLAAGEAQFLVDIGTAKFEEPGKVKVVPTSYLTRIPVAP
jgi:hypothetical protein